MAYETTEELAVFVEKELGHELSGPSSQRGDILTQLDQAHKKILAGGGFLNWDDRMSRLAADTVFSFARSTQPKILTLQPLVTSIRATVTTNSTALTLSEGPAASISGWHFQTEGTDTVYRIASHTAGATTATLDSEYVDDNVSAGSCGLAKLQYTVGSSDMLRLISPIRIYGDEATISFVDKDELLDQVPLSCITYGTPELCTILNYNEGTLTLMFPTMPDEYERLEIEYVPIPSTLSISPAVNPILPKHFREIIAHAALFFMMVRNDDNRASTHLNIARDMFAELKDWDEKLMLGGDEDFGRVLIAKRW